MDGTVIGNYRVLKKLGEGGMGAVYVAEHSLIGRKAAIKVLLPTLSAHQDIVQRFFNEARAATAINDPGIVQIFDFGYHTDGSAFIVMEFLEGETLDGRLRRLGRLPAHDAVRIMRQVASSLASAHARGIIHRDLKPENIFLVRDAEVAGGERAKVLDFGIAKLTGDDAGSKVKTNTAAIMGTPYFMSPEQCRGAGQVDHRSDVYSLGCVLFQLVTGGPPFEAEGAGELIAAHLMMPPPAPSSRAPGIPPEIDEVVLRCLQKGPDHRYQSMEELASVLGQLTSRMTAPGALTVAAPSGGYTPYVTPPPVGSYGTPAPVGAYGTQPPAGAYGTQPPAGYGTQPPSHYGTTPGAASSPTTLSSVASQVEIAPAPRKRGLGMAIAAVALAAAGAVAAVIVMGGRSSTAPAATPDPDPQPEIADPTPPPQPEVEPPPPQPEVEPPPPQPEIPEVEPEPEPAATAAADPKKRKERRRESRGGSQGSQGSTGKTSGSGVPGDLDGDGIPDQR
jgi:eukaryotic-like serine/threonine-protein kinase